MSNSPWDDFNKNDDIYSRKSKNKFIKKFNNFNFQSINSIFIFILFTIIMVILWFASGIYTIKEGEQGIVLRFGKFYNITYPGLNYHFPSPIETVIIENVSKSRRVEIGYRSNNNYTGNIRSISNESIMLTGDQNIVELNCDIMWHIDNIKDYVFNIANPQNSVKFVAQSVIREVVAEKNISSILSSQKQAIADQIEQNIQVTLNKYNAGVKIEQVQLLKAEPPSEVRPAFIDVQTSKADKEREINNAYAYRNNIIPKAKGESVRLIQEAEAYKEEVVESALGKSKRFNDLLEEYINNQEIMKERIYLDTVEKIISRSSKKVIVGNEVLPHLSVNQIKN